MITVLLSGGIDSFVAAFLLLKAKVRITALHFVIDDKDLSIKIDKSKETEYLCKKLDIPLEIIDVTKEFRTQVIDDFVTGYKTGKTPNPCIVCNKAIKFGCLRKFTEGEIATGHYVNLKKDKNHAIIRKHKDHSHDQAYFLYRIPYDILKKTIFPLSDMSKNEVIELGRLLDYSQPISSSTYHGSTDLCFTSNDKLYQFLGQFIPNKVGDIRDIVDNKVVGEHDGLWKYTIGQRKGIGIGGTGPYFVVKKDHNSNTLWVSNQLLSQNLLTSNISIRDINILHPDYLNQSKFEALMQHRYQSAHAPATIEISGKTATVTAKSNIKAPTPGQSAVFYTKQGDLIGGGIITMDKFH
ncbi:tRNA 2-thiouridine(34) synthase MnmA [Candidatus Dojkabacteria bacterium]|nr:tRNA 2-thiouridine(34) synthase MnmA [Candidatus Dojkabacteria bacterium]